MEVKAGGGGRVERLGEVGGGASAGREEARHVVEGGDIAAKNSVGSRCENLAGMGAWGMCNPIRNGGVRRG